MRLYNDLQMYRETRSVPHLVHCLEVPSPSTDGHLTVKLQPVGYEREPDSERELRSAVRAALIALRGIHAVGFVHRDVRWPNMLRDEQVSCYE